MAYFVRISHIIRINIGYISSRNIRSVCDFYNLLLFKQIYFIYSYSISKKWVLTFNMDRDISDILILKNRDGTITNHVQSF